MLLDPRRRPSRASRSGPDLPPPESRGRVRGCARQLGLRDRFSPARRRARTRAAPSAEVAKLHALFDAQWERALRDNPLAATYLGDPRYDDRWPDLTRANLDRIAAADRAGARRPRRDPARPAAAGGATELRPVPEGVREPGRGAALPPGVLHDQPEPGRPPDAERTAGADRLLDGRGLRGLAEAAGDAARPPRPGDRVAPRRRGAEAHAAARADGARRAAAADAAGRDSRAEPVLRPVPPVPGHDSRGRPRTADGPRTRRDRHARAARVPEVRRVLPHGVPAEDARDRRDLGHAGRRRLLREPRGVLHDDRPRAGPDPRDRPAGSGAHPGRDAEGHGRGRVPRHPAGVLREAAHGPAVLLHHPGRAVPRLRGRRQADRAGAAEAVRPAVPHAVRRARGAGHVRAEHDHRLLPGPVDGRHARRLLLREPLPARGAAEVRDRGADRPRVGARPPPADRARAGAGRAAEVPSLRRLHRVHRRAGRCIPSGSATTSASTRIPTRASAS
jgi:hypothetical protein